VGVQPSATCRVCDAEDFGVSDVRSVAGPGAHGRHFFRPEDGWKVDHLDGPDKIKLTKQSSPNGEHHHFIPVSWIDHVDQHVHLNKTGADVTAHWEHEGRV
jgi:hypothetical protein